jgi:hypothetical protein
MIQGGVMTQKGKRYVSLLGIFAASGFFIWLGDAYRVGGVPAHYIGYLVAAVGVAGVFGVNIWAGGTLDIKNDPKVGAAEKPHGHND